MMSKKTRKYLPLAVGCPALWSMQAAAQTEDQRINQLQRQINSLQQQIQNLHAMQNNQNATPNKMSGRRQEQKKPQVAEPAVEKKKSKKKLHIGGNVVAEYDLKTGHDQSGQRTGGNLYLYDFDLNISGDSGTGITYAADYYWSSYNIADDQFLHKGWAAYNFGFNDSQQIKGGFFQVPFGNLPYGYQSFWAPLRYYIGAADNQAAGLGYKYESGPFRLDIDAFKNDDLQQPSTYGANPFDGYDQINGGNVRLGYTFNSDSDNAVNISAAVRGGQLEVDNDMGGGDDNGTHWAATAAVNANLGHWLLEGQYTDYRYNVPDNTNLPRDSIQFEDFGAPYLVPASGQLYSASLARKIPVDLGPIDSFTFYDDYGYLNVGGDGHYLDLNQPNHRTGNSQFNVVGVNMVAGPIYIWIEGLSGKNAAMAFDGSNDGDWHHQFHLTAAYYFGGDVIN